MMTPDYGTNSIGTKEWLQATAQFTIKAYTEVDEAPHALDTEALAPKGFADTVDRASKLTEPAESSSGT